MRQRLASADLCLEELFSGRYQFSIPAYQRDYAWGAAEAHQLIDDIAVMLGEEGREGVATPYFLGAMLFVERDSVLSFDGERTAQRVDVVDGQQRLITMAIVFAVLRDLAGEAGVSLDALLCAQAGRAIVAVDVDQHNDAPSSYQLQLRPADAAFFRTFIQTPGASLRRPPDDAIATSLARRNIEDVRRAVTRKFRDDYDDSARASFTAFARRHARVLVVSSDDFDYAYQIFLTINDRGKRLSVEDIFRGEILGPLDAGQRQRYETLIDEMDKYREQSAQPPSKGKTFFSHLAAIHGWRSRGIIAGLKRTVQRRGGPKRFVGEIFEPMAEAYLRIKGSAAALPLTREIEERLVLLRWLELHGDDDWVAPAMLGLVRYPDDHQRLATLLDGLDRFAHGLALMGCGRDARRKLYAPVLKALGSAAPIPDLDAVFALKLDDQRQIMQRVATRLHQADPPSVRLLLLRADHWLTGRPLTYYEPLIAPARTAGERFTVEHVCPQGDVEAGEWTQLFPDKRQRSAASQCIGNLALVTETQNKRMNQHPFAHKTKVLFDGPASTPFALTDMLGDEPVWDAAAIERRYSVIMTAVVGIWGLTAAIPPCPAST